MITKKQFIDLNGLIRAFNILIFLVSVSIFRETNPYTDLQTIILGFSIMLQIQLILTYEKRNRDPFVLLLSLNIVIYYCLRILTLAYLPDSTILARFGVQAQGINQSLLFIFWGIWAIFLGLTTTKYNVNKPINTSNLKIFFSPYIIIAIFLVVLVSSLYFKFFAGLGRIDYTNYSRLASYINMLINPQIVIIFTIIYLRYNRDKLSIKNKNLFIIAFVLLTLFFIVSGKRSAILLFVMCYIFSTLAAEGRIFIRKKMIALALILLLPTAIFSFAFASYARNILEFGIDRGAQKIDIMQVIIQLKNYNKIFEYLKWEPIFQRMGYLDMAADQISNSMEYGQVINIEYYFKSIIDASTPGFDIFHYKRASLAVRNIYTRMPIFSSIQGYNSDQFTIFGEYYVLFKGYGALLVLFIVAHIFKLIYLYISFKENYYYKTFYRAVLLVIFDMWLNSFGMDWFIIETPRLLVTTWLLIMLLKACEKRLKVG